jgi:hypothetical protein
LIICTTARGETPGAIATLEVWMPGDDEKTFEPNLVFVVMPMNDQTKGVYNAIKDECRRLHLRVVRTDGLPGSRNILKQIRKHIKKAEFIICDLSEERPNVYYELGYAHGVGNEAEDILLLAKKGTKIHFNISGFTVREYSSIDDLRSLLATNLSDLIQLREKPSERNK